MTGLLFVFLSATLISQSFMDAMSVVIILYMLTKRFSKKATFDPLLPGPSFSIETVFFILWLATIAIGLKDSPVFIKNLLEWKWLLNIYFMYWFLNLFLDRNAPKDNKDIFNVSFWRPLYWVLAACFVYGEISYLSGIDLFKQTPLTHGARFAGPFDDPMNFAHIYGMYAGFLGSFVLVYFGSWIDKRMYRPKLDDKYLHATIIFAITAYSVALSLTRGAWIGLFVAIVVICFIFRFRWGLATIVSGVVAALLMYQVSTTFKIRVDQALNPAQSYDSERYNLWRSNWEMFIDHPIFGIGHGDYKLFLPVYFEKLGIPADHFQSHAHNQYLHFLSNTGIIGFAFYMIFIAWILLHTYRGYNKYRNPVLLGSLAAQIAFHIGSLTECNFERAKVRLVYLFFCALSLSVVRFYESKTA